MEAAILCGGEGTRLRPLTYTVPKPLLPLGSKPILEVIVTRMKEQGFQKFYLMVNYKKDMIRSYFGSGSSFNVQFEYIEEKTRRGTAGPLSMLRERITSPFITMNADVLTSMNFRNLMKFHEQKNADLTVALKRFERKIAYGVVETDNNQNIIEIREKPDLSFLINSGIYAVSPSVLELIPDDGVFLMTELVEKAAASGMSVAGYEFTEPWRDIGRIDDYMKAISDMENGHESDTDGVFA